MQVEYVFEPKGQYKAIVAFVGKNFPFSRFARFVLFLGFVFLWISLIFIFKTNSYVYEITEYFETYAPRRNAQVILPCLILSFLCLFIWRVKISQVGQRLCNSYPTDEKITIRLDESSIIYETPNNFTRINDKLITSVQLLQGHLTIGYFNNYSLIAIPISAFSNDADRQAFEQAVQEKISRI